MAVVIHPPCACPHEEQLLEKWLANYHQKEEDALERNIKDLAKFQLEMERTQENMVLLNACDGDEHLTKSFIVEEMGINKLWKVAKRLGIILIYSQGQPQETSDELKEAILSHPCTSRELEKYC